MFYIFFVAFNHFHERKTIMKKEISLKGKTAIVTGGATGIGFAIASELLDADANVIILGRREAKLKEAVEKLGEHCSYYVFDVTDTAHYDKLISKIEETTPIDILVNNAGINNKKDYFDFTEEELDTIIATQAKAPFLFSQAVAARMKEHKSGCILFISSLASILGMAAAFLCSDAARFISGIDLVVDGGISSSFLL